MNKKAFSLVELIFVFAILVILGTSSLSVYRVWQTKNTTSSTKMIVLQSLYEAKENALFGVNDSNWGVKYTSNDIILFSGNSFLERDVAQDKIFNLAKNSDILNLDELIFNKFDGLPSDTPTIIFYGEDSSEQIIISAQGVFNN